MKLRVDTGGMYYPLATFSDLKQAAEEEECKLILKSDIQETAWRCSNCHGIYLDEPVTQCDCLPMEDTFYQCYIVKGEK